jgi:hypothetical protein
VTVPRRPDLRGRSRRGIHAVEPLEHRERIFERRPAVDGRLQQSPRFSCIATAERRRAAVQQFLRLPLALGERAARALDVRPRAGMAAVEKQRACPDVDGELVVRGEVMVESGEEEVFDSGVAIRVGGRVYRPRRIGTRGVFLRIAA